MALYRILKQVTYGGGVVLQSGILHDLKKFSPETIARLEVVEAVARISAPPLALLPGWAARARQLKALNIITAEDFLEADIEQLSRALSLNSETVMGYKKALIAEWLTAKAPQEGCETC